MAEHERVRLDRWLWAARFFRTRALAKAAIEGGKVHLHVPGTAQPIRPKVSKEIAVGDSLTIRRGEVEQTVVVRGLSDRRGSATVAGGLYDETADSVEQREADRARRKMERLGLTVPQRKPSKRDRRALTRLKQDR